VGIQHNLQSLCQISFNKGERGRETDKAPPFGVKLQHQGSHSQNLGQNHALNTFCS